MFGKVVVFGIGPRGWLVDVPCSSVVVTIEVTVILIVVTTIAIPATITRRLIVAGRTGRAVVVVASIRVVPVRRIGKRLPT